MDPAYLDRLRTAYHGQGLTLYLGAGVSVGSGLPTWDQLVLAMYFATAEGAAMGGWRPYSNYLYAIAEWYLGRRREPLEVTARKIRLAHPDPASFLSLVWETLYAPFAAKEGSMDPAAPEHLRDRNRTLDAVAKLCEGPEGDGRGVTSVITYNYDALLETVLKRPGQPVWTASRVPEDGEAPDDALPIYHVHGYVPMEGCAESAADEIVFTEDQYHRVAQNPYSWSNIVQLRCMTATVGLMVGLSLSDRNIRRLLDAASRTPVCPEIYALLLRPRWTHPAKEALAEIDQAAQKYYHKFNESSSPSVKPREGKPGAGIKGRDNWEREVKMIVGAVEELDRAHETRVLNDLGIHPIWYDDHAEIPGLIDEIMKKP